MMHNVRQPTTPNRLGAQMAGLGRQVLLVPEAALLLTLLCAYYTLGAPPLLALLGLLLALAFATRLGLLLAARRSMATADYDLAERLATAATWLHPWSADAQSLLGTLRLARGQAEGAVAALRRAVACYPDQAALQAALSAALLEAGDPRAALVEARRAVALDPTCAPAYLHMAAADVALGARPEAVEAELRAGLSRPAHPADEAALRCALAEQLLAQNRPGEARLALAGAEALLPRCPAPQRAGLHYHIGELLRQTGEVDAARNHFSASESIDPNGLYAAAAWRAARS